MKKLVLCLTLVACAPQQVPPEAAARNGNFDVGIKGALALNCGVSQNSDYATSFDRAKDEDFGRIADCLIKGEMMGKNVIITGRGNAMDKNDAVDAVAMVLQKEGVPNERITRKLRNDLKASDEVVLLEVSN